MVYAPPPALRHWRLACGVGRKARPCNANARFCRGRLATLQCRLASLTIKSSGPDVAHPSLFDSRKKVGFRSTDFLSGLKAEANRGFNQPVEGGRTATAAATKAAEIARATGGNPEVRRAEIAHGPVEIHVVQHVLEADTERQVVAMGFAAAKTTAAEAASAATTAAGTTTAATTAAREATAATAWKATTTAGTASSTLT